MFTRKSIKKIILLTALGVFSFFWISTYAINFDLIASNFVNKMQTKYSKLSCDDQVSKMTFWSSKFEKINQSYSTNTKISRQQKILISILLQTIIKKFESQSKILKYNCVDKVPETWNNIETATWWNTWNDNLNNQDSQFSSLQIKMLDAVNKERIKNWKNKLSLNAKLNNAAQKYAKYLYDVNKWVSYWSQNFRFDHYSKDWKSPFDRIKAEWYEFRAAGENIAVWQPTIEEVMKDRMNSEWHRKNILSKEFKEIWVWYYKDFWVQDFGRERQ